MYKDISIYSIAGTVEAIVTHPIEVIRTRYVNRTPIWRGIRNVYSGIGVQVLGIIPERIVFVGSRDICIQNGYKWYQYSPFITILQTAVSVPFLSWKTAKIEGIPLRIKPYGIYPLYMRNMIFASCLFGAKEELPKWGYTHSIGNTICGVSAGVTLSHPFDVIRTLKQSKFRDISYSEVYSHLHKLSTQNGIITTYWRGCMGRLTVACIGITALIETTEYLMKHRW
jgi:hypothetical protein